MGFFDFLRRNPEVDDDPKPDPVEDVRRFSKGEWVQAPTASGQTELARYDAINETLWVQYRDGAVWSYERVTPSMAADFFTTMHKQTWIWDHIRVRGKGNFHKHQVPAQLEAFQ